MKKIVALLAFTLVFINCNRNQTYNLSQFYNKYKEHSDVSMKVPGILARIATKDPEAQKWVKKLKSAKILVIDKNEAKNVGNIRTDLMRALQGEKLDELISVNSDGFYVSVQILEDKEKIKKLVIGVDEADEFVLIDTKINASLDDLTELINDVEEKGSKSKSISTIF